MKTLYTYNKIQMITRYLAEQQWKAAMTMRSCDFLHLVQWYSMQVLKLLQMQQIYHIKQILTFFFERKNEKP